MQEETYSQGVNDIRELKEALEGSEVNSPEPEKVVEEVRTAELPQFSITTSQEDILSKISSFNPFPEKASQGISVWSNHYLTSNAGVTIRYEATGEMYQTSVPVAYAENEVRISPLYAAPEPFTGVDGQQIGSWHTLDQFMQYLSRDLVEDEEHSRDISPILNDAVVKRFVTDEDGKQEPVFETPDDAYVKIVRGAVQALGEGKWREAAALTNYGYRVGEYTIDGSRYKSEASKVFEYTTRELAFDAVPSLKLDSGMIMQDTGLADLAYKTAGDVTQLIRITVREQALLAALEEFSHSPVAIGHIETTLLMIRTWKADYEDQLSKQKSPGGITYLDQFKQYLAANGIALGAYLRFDADEV